MATIKDVSKKANVSTATVSHVINGTRFVSEETAQKVREAMKELNYTPNMAALSLRTKKTKTVGVLIPVNFDETSNIFFMQVMLGIDSVLKKKGYFTFLSNTHDSLEREMEELQNMLNRQIDGLIIAPAGGDHSSFQKLAGDIEVVYVDRLPGGAVSGQNCVVSDAEAGCREAVNGMIEAGHRKIGVLSGILGAGSNTDERFEGYKKALKDHGISYCGDYLREGKSCVEDGYNMTKELFENTDITALIALSNMMGMGAMQYLSQKRIRVPEKISITVFDDYKWTESYNPPLTVIRQEAYEMGKKAAEVLIKRMEAKSKGKKKIYRLKTKLIERESWKKI